MLPSTLKLYYGANINKIKYNCGTTGHNYTLGKYGTVNGRCGQERKESIEAGEFKDIL